LKKRTKIIISIVAVIVFIYLLPFFAYLLANKNTKQFMFEQVAYKTIADNITKDCSTDSAKTMKIYEFVVNRCREPKEGENPKYNNTFDVFTHKTASCDQQVWLMMALLRVENIDARMVFLRGYDSISRHTVAEVNINGHYGMLDPFYHRYLYNNQQQLASVDDIIKGNLPKAGMGYVEPVEYWALFKPTFPYKIHSDNKLDSPHRFIRSILWGYKAVLGKAFTGPFKAMH
jgi:hypothetical protein